MSLALVQAYSSEEEVQEKFSDSDSEEQEEDEEHGGGRGSPAAHEGEVLEDYSQMGGTCVPSSLPSATAIFSEVTGPPEYLKDRLGLGAAKQLHSNPRKLPYGSKLMPSSRTRKELPPGAVVEAKPQAGILTDQANQFAKEEARKPPEDAAKLLGVCVHCSVPKTYSAAKEGLVCPICKDRPRSYDDDLSKRKGSRIKDKERSKRMKGQSSHATWKSETEMHLRQQFD